MVGWHLLVELKSAVDEDLAVNYPSTVPDCSSILEAAVAVGVVHLYHPMALDWYRKEMQNKYNAKVHFGILTL